MEKTQREIAIHKFLKNALIFTAPAAAIFFGELAMGKKVEEAWPVALIALYGLCADFMKKLPSMKN